MSMSYVLVTPYTIAKSRTGGLLARLLSRSDLELAGAQMITPGEAFVADYARILRKYAPPDAGFLADYVVRNLAPSGGRHRRSLFLLFKGDEACQKLAALCGGLYPEHREADAADIADGETIRDTYADLVVSPDNPAQVAFFEPAVLTPWSDEEAKESLARFAVLLENSDNVIETEVYPGSSGIGAAAKGAGAGIERTLVIIKPDNWTYHSSRPGTILDMFSQTGLRIIGMKVHYFSLEEALDFYGPVEEALQAKLAPVFGQKARAVLEREFCLQLNDETETALSGSFGRAYAREQFYQLVEFMSGHRPDRAESRAVKCMVVVYEGRNAVEKTRAILGATDPHKARDGTIRREFGSTVMVNAAHASDSPESFAREQTIVRIHENGTAGIIREYTR